MNLDAIIALASLCVTVTLAVGGGAIRICAKIEKISSLFDTLVTKEECAGKQRECLMHRRAHSRRKRENHE